jgi:outer membrane biosynthesis protein TonB
MKKAKLASALVIGTLTILTASPIAIAQSSPALTAPQTSSPSSAVATSEQLSTLEQETPFKMGGKVKPPRLISSPTPKEFPSPAPPGQKGYAIVSFVVSSTGIPNRIHIVRSAGPLEKNAPKVVETIKQSRFQPGTRDGHPVAVLMTTEIDFSLFN